MKDILQKIVVAGSVYNMILPAILCIPVIDLAIHLFQTRDSSRSIGDPILKVTGIAFYFGIHVAAAVIVMRAINTRDLEMCWYWIYFSIGELLLTLACCMLLGNFLKLSSIVGVALVSFHLAQIVLVYAFTQDVLTDVAEKKALASTVVGWAARMFTASQT